MSGLLSDVRLGLRALARKPGVAVIAVVTLALGMGATSAIFSVVDAVLVRNLPYPDAGRLVLLWSTFANAGGARGGSALPDYRARRDESRSFAGMGGFYYRDLDLVSGAGEPEDIQAACVTASLFPTIGIAPRLGRGFVAEDETFGRHYVALLSHRLWQRRFGGDPNVVGSQVQIGGVRHTIVGVMPAGMPFLDDIPRVDLWVPLSFPVADNMDSRNNHFIYIVGRLGPGATIARAQGEVDAISRRVVERFPEAAGVGGLVVSLDEQLTSQVRPALLILFGAVALLLLVACVNVANLLLARAVGREKEMAIRASLGATRRRLLRMAFVESLLLALAGAAAGLFLAWWGLEAMAGLLPENLPRYNAIAVDARVLGFTLGLGVVTVVIFGTLPALQVTRPAVLKEVGSRITHGRRRRLLRGVLVALETGLALVLLTVAGLLVRSFIELRNADPGFVADNMLALRIQLTGAKYPEPTRGAAFFADLTERLRALPDVRAAGASTALPLGFGAGWGKYLYVEDGPQPTSLEQIPNARFALVDHDFFRALGVALRRGRAFTRDEGERAPPVAIVNETVARRYLGAEPVGKWIRMCPPPALLAHSECPRRQVVGVVADSKTDGMMQDASAQVYVPYRQFDKEGWMGGMSIVVRTRGAPAAALAGVRAQMREIDAEQPIAEIATGEELLGRSVSLNRFSMVLLGLFALLAVILAGVGIYGVVSYLTAQRTQEIGVRLALGARPRDVVALVLREGMAMALAGVGLGLVAALAATHLVRGLLYGVAPTDPISYAVVTVPLVGLALLACWLPARRASRTDPMQSLRTD